MRGKNWEDGTWQQVIGKILEDEREVELWLKKLEEASLKNFF